MDNRETGSFHQAIGSSDTLHAPNKTLPYTLETDASGTAALVAFYSCKLTPVERRYAATEVEALADIRHFEMYLKGARFLVETNHKALTFIQTMKRGSPRWAALLQEHNCQLTYRPGSTNTVADTLRKMLDEDACQRDLDHQSLLVKPQDTGTSPTLWEEPQRQLDRTGLETRGHHVINTRANYN